MSRFGWRSSTPLATRLSAYVEREAAIRNSLKPRQFLQAIQSGLSSDCEYGCGERVAGLSIVVIHDTGWVKSPSNSQPSRLLAGVFTFSGT